MEKDLMNSAFDDFWSASYQKTKSKNTNNMFLKDDQIYKSQPKNVLKQQRENVQKLKLQLQQQKLQSEINRLNKIRQQQSIKNVKAVGKVSYKVGKGIYNTSAQGINAIRKSDLYKDIKKNTAKGSGQTTEYLKRRITNIFKKKPKYEGNALSNVPDSIYK